MCRHAKRFKRPRTVIVRGYVVRGVVCRMCHSTKQRERRAVKNALAMLARMPAP